MTATEGISLPTEDEREIARLRAELARLREAIATERRAAKSRMPSRGTLSTAQCAAIVIGALDRIEEVGR